MTGSQYNKGNSFLNVNTSLKPEDLLLRVNNLVTKSNLVLSERDSKVWPQVLASLNDKGNPWPVQQHVLMEAERQFDEQLGRYLCARYRYDFYPVFKTIADYPPCLQIEPSSVCNFRCVFCFQTDKSLTKAANGHMGQISVEMFKRIVDEVEGKIDFITLASRGEPLLNRKLAEMLSYAKGKFLGLKMNTNASKLTPELSRVILSAELSTLVFSVDAGDKETYEKLRINGSFELIMNNIKNFKEIKESEFPESRILTRVSGVLYNEKEQDFRTHIDSWSSTVDQVAFVDYLPWENPYKATPTNINSACSDLWRRMFIWWDGKANPCDVDYLSWLSVGDFQQSTITEIWNSQGYRELRERHLSGQRKSLLPCSSCFLV